MHLSVNELETLARKAAVGAGLDYGHAGEAARCLVRLVAAGFDGVGMLTRALQAWSAGDTGPLMQSPGGGRLVPAGERPACVLYAAPAIRDFAQTMSAASSLDRIEVPGVPLPGWTVGQALAGTWPAGLTLRCTEPGSSAVRWTVENTRGQVLVRDGRIDARDIGDLVLSRAGKDGASTPARTLAPDMSRLYEQGVEVEPADYDALRVYFDLTLVPDSEASRQHGAGAGLVDTD